MKIVNKTQWDSKDIARVVRAVVAQNNKDEGSKLPSFTLVIKEKREGYFGYGIAYKLNPFVVTLRLSKNYTENLDVFKIGFAIEFVSCIKRRKNPIARKWTYGTPEHYPYLKGMSISVGTEKSKIKKDTQQLKYQRALQAAKRWEAKKLRAIKAEKKALSQVKKLEKLFLSNGKIHLINKTFSDI